MGCGASLAQPPGAPVEVEQDPWDALTCEPALLQQLRGAGLAYSTVRAVVDFGIEEQSHLVMLKPEDVEGMQLKNKVQQRLLLSLLLEPASKQHQHPQQAQQPQAAEPQREELANHEEEHLPPRERLRKLHADKHKLANLVKQGLNLGVKFLDAVGPILPVPGPSAAKLLSTIMSHCSKALANKGNMQRLAEKCAYLMGLLAGHLKPASSPDETESGMTSERAYRDLMDQFRDMLKSAERYCGEYTKRAWLWRILNSPGDDKEYNALVKTLAQLIAEATLAVALDCQSQGTQIQADVQKLAGDIEAQLAFVDTGKQLREFAEQKGGIKVIMGDPALMREAVATIDISQQLSLEMVRRHMEAYTIRAMDVGAHTNIRHHDLREMWYKASFGECKVRWEAWWTVLFPRRMEDILQPDEYQELCAILESDTARAQFKDAVDEYDEEHISVDELYLKFPPDVNVLARTKELIALGHASTRAMPAMPVASDADRPSCLARKQQLAKCALPQVDRDMYVGRDAAALAVCKRLSGDKRAVLLLGPGGLGKSTLAADVGWRLWDDGLLLGGATMVNLRDATTLEQQLQRLCQAMAMSYDDTARQRILSKLLDLTPSSRMLLVLDNAEDCLCSPAANEFAQLLAQVQTASAAVLLLITSRSPWPSTSGTEQLQGYEQYTVPPVDTASTQQLLRSLCPADVLSDGQLEFVATACKGSPMMTRLLAAALEAGTLAAEDIISHSKDANEYDLVLTALRKQQLQDLSRLTVFSHGFDEEDAAAVLSCSAQQALTGLQVLHAHSLILYDAARGQHYIHMTLKQQVATRAELPVVKAAQEAFVMLFMGRLTEWAGLYQTAQFSLALGQVRQHAANLKAAWQLVDSGSLSEACIEAVAEAATGAMTDLLYDAGLNRDTPSWQKLVQRKLVSKLSVANIGQLAAMTEEQKRHHLTECEKLLGPEHPSTIASINHLAACLLFKGQYAAAEPMYRSAMELRRKVLGPEHPSTISSINNLAECLKQRSQYAAAEPMYRSALELRQKVLGPEHPDTITSINNLAHCLDALKQHAAAEPIYRSALELRQKVLGPEHPDTITSINNLADCLIYRRRYAAAEPLYRSALELRRKVLGAEHPDNHSNIENLAKCLAGMGQCRAAATMLHSRPRRVQHPEHANTCCGINNLKARGCGFVETPFGLI